jgi:kynurenine formamidase
VYKLLSYPITACVPTWPGNPQLRLERQAQMAHGDVCNTTLITVFNHTGTHYDAPNHFVAEGLQISKLPLKRFIFERPLLLDIPKEANEKIMSGDLHANADKITKCDLLMIRTGFSKYRTSDIKRFEECGPALSSECSRYLVSNFKNLMAVAVDFVSIASYSDSEDGNLTHQILLGGLNGKHEECHFICAIEDVNMAGLDGSKLKKVFCLPLMVDGVDSAPLTIVAQEE